MKESFRNKIELLLSTCAKDEATDALKAKILEDVNAKYEECIGYGYDKRTAYVIALKEMKKYSREIWTQEKKFFVSLKWEKFWRFLGFTASYFLAFIIVYLTTSFLVDNSWGWTWSIIVGATLVYFALTSILLFRYFSARDKYILAGFFIWSATYVATTAIFLLVSFLTGLWKYTWIAFIAAFAIAYVLNLTYLWFAKIRKPNKIDVFLVALATCITAYFVISFILASFRVTWLVFLIFVFLFLVYATLGIHSKKEEADDDDDFADAEKQEALDESDSTKTEDRQDENTAIADNQQDVSGKEEQ